MKRLVIHPKDRSTTFLTQIYQELDNVTLVDGGVSRNDLEDMVRDHDQVMMMGHGSPFGLMSVGQFPGRPFNVIDDTFAPLLEEKDNSVFIWCNADQYVKFNKLRGFYTGMFISELSEALIMGVNDANEDDVNESNYSFVRTVSKLADFGPDLMHAAARHEYGKLTAVNPVVRYNHERLYIT
jgi:hypothetical protein